MAFKCVITIAVAMLFISTSIQNQLTHPDNAGAHYTNEWVLHIDGTVSDAKSIARQMGFIYHSPVHHMEGFHVLKHRDKISHFSKFHQNRLRRHALVRKVEQQIAKVRTKRGAFNFNDPMYDKEWYLLKGAKGGYDMNVREAWARGYTGKGVVITILDDGIEHTHPDLRKNYDPKASYDINDNDNDPIPRTTFNNENKHGTRCAGEVASKANNHVCNVGVAYNSRIGGVRMLDGDITDSVEGRSLGLRQDHIDIYSGSWGPDDMGKVVDGPGVMARAAFKNGVEKGRGGLGNIFVWASGNGGNYKDSCACDGYAGSIYTLSVSSVSENNQKPWYLEECASTLTSTYSSGHTGERQIITTDLHAQCTDAHTGTSASAPLAAGIIALALEANRQLTWRDVQYITLLTSNPAPFVDAGWITNGVGRKTSLLYGYGLMDAGKMVYLAPAWRRVPKQQTCLVENKINKSFYGKAKATIIFDANSCKTDGKKDEKGPQTIQHVEHVLLYLKFTYTRRGDLKITLISPSGTRSVMLPPRQLDSVGGQTNFDKWPLMSVQFWGEKAAGKWQLEIENAAMNSHNGGKLVWGNIKIFGVDQQPIRLRPVVGKVPEWYSKDFLRYAMTDAEYKNRELGKNRKGEHNTQCHEECANSTACSGERANQCDACRHFRVTSDGSCVAKCPDGTFSATQRSCQACHLKCAQCSGPLDRNCTECHENSALLPDQHRCLDLGESCPPGTFLSSDKKECRPCASPCESCTSMTSCTKCRDDNGTWVLSPTGQCVRACPERYFVSSDRICLACPSSCSSCMSGREDGCTSCTPPNILLKTNRKAKAGNCVPHCPTGFYLDHSANVCLRCHESCDSCRGKSEKECITCRKPLVFYQKRCADPADLVCENGKYKKFGRCLDCHPTCERCDGGSASNCLECKGLSDVFYHGHCQSNCPDGFYPHNRTDKFAKHGFTTSCVYCHALCAACHGPSPSHCIRCYSGLTLTPSGTCKPKCAEGSSNQGSGSVCEPCFDKGCAVCSSPRKCLQCREGHILIKGSCKIGGICPSGHGSLNGRCVSCPDPACDACSGNGLQTCSKCIAKHQLDSTGKCRSTQPCRATEFRDKNKICRPCHARCRTCTGPGDEECTSCHPSACFILGVCRPCCSSSVELPTSPFACANCSISPSPSCLFPYASPNKPEEEVNGVRGTGLFANLPNPARLLILTAFLTCIILPLTYICIFCVLQIRSGESMCCFRSDNRHPAGPDYAPLSTGANGSPEKVSFSDDEMEMRKMNSNVIINTSNHRGNDSDESSGVGSSPEKSPDRNGGINFHEDV